MQDENSVSRIGRNVDKMLKPYARLWVKALGVTGQRTAPVPIELRSSIEMLRDFVISRRWTIGCIWMGIVFTIISVLVSHFMDDVSNIKHVILFRGVRVTCIGISVTSLILAFIHCRAMLQNKPDKVRMVSINQFFGDTLFLIAIGHLDVYRMCGDRVDRIEYFKLCLLDSLEELIRQKTEEGGMLELSIPGVRDAQVSIAVCILKAQEREKSFADESWSKQWRTLLYEIRYSCARLGVSSESLEAVFRKAKTELGILEPNPNEEK